MNDFSYPLIGSTRFGLSLLSLRVALNSITLLHLHVDIFAWICVFVCHFWVVSMSSTIDNELCKYVQNMSYLWRQAVIIRQTQPHHLHIKMTACFGLQSLSTGDYYKIFQNKVQYSVVVTCRKTNETQHFLWMIFIIHYFALHVSDYHQSIIRSIIS